MKSTYARAMAGTTMTAVPVKKQWVYLLVATLFVAMGAMAPQESVGLLMSPIGMGAVIAIGLGFVVSKSMALTPWAFVSGAVLLYGLASTQMWIASISAFAQLFFIGAAVMVGAFQLRVQLVGGEAARRPPRARWGSVLVASTAAVVVISLGFSEVPLVHYVSRILQEGKSRPPTVSSTYDRPVRVGRVQDRSLSEVSGLVASATNLGVLWTHNDSGNPAFLYCITSAGSGCGVWNVAGAANEDWEDVAVGPGPLAHESYLYIADIGDNVGSRAGVTVYRIPEPTVDSASRVSSARAPETTASAQAIELRYPDGAHDAEALLVHPVTGDLYIVTKETVAGVYRAASLSSVAASSKLERVARLTLPGVLTEPTGGAISPDGRRVVVSTYGGAYELNLASPTGDSAGSFNDLWTQTPTRIDIGDSAQLEAITYSTNGAAILFTSEGVRSPIYRTVGGAPRG